MNEEDRQHDLLTDVDFKELAENQQTTVEVTQDLLNYFKEKDKQELVENQKQEKLEKVELDKQTKLDKQEKAEEDKLVKEQTKQVELDTIQKEEEQKELQLDKQLQLEFNEIILDNAQTESEQMETLLVKLDEITTNQEEIILQEATQNMADDVVTAYGTMIIPGLIVCWLLMKIIKPFT